MKLKSKLKRTIVRLKRRRPRPADSLAGVLPGFFPLMIS